MWNETLLRQCLEIRMISNETKVTLVFCDFKNWWPQIVYPHLKERFGGIRIRFGLSKELGAKQCFLRCERKTKVRECFSSEYYMIYIYKYWKFLALGWHKLSVKFTVQECVHLVKIPGARWIADQLLFCCT